MLNVSEKSVIKLLETKNGTFLINIKCTTFFHFNFGNELLL